MISFMRFKGIESVASTHKSKKTKMNQIYTN